MAIAQWFKSDAAKNAPASEAGAIALKRSGTRCSQCWRNAPIELNPPSGRFLFLF